MAGENVFVEVETKKDGIKETRPILLCCKNKKRFTKQVGNNRSHPKRNFTTRIFFHPRGRGVELMDLFYPQGISHHPILRLVWKSP